MKKKGAFLFPKNIIIMGLFGILINGCSKVDQVKEGYFEYDSSTTIGKAFDASFANTTWNEFTTEKGQDFVEFTGLADVDFLELVANGIIDAVGEDIANPLSGETALHRCVDNEWATMYQSELMKSLLNISIASFGLATLSNDLEANIKSNLKVEIVSKIASRPRKIRIQFNFDMSDPSHFELGYYGFMDHTWDKCEINELIDNEDLLKFIYSNHIYADFDFKKIASEIVDASESKNELPDSLFRKRTKKMSDIRKILIYKEILSDNRVATRIETEKKAEEERKRIETEKKLNSAKSEVLSVFKDYKSKFDQFDFDDDDFPRWDDVGFSAPESEFFEITDGSGPWGVLMETKPDVVGVKCSFKLFCRPMYMEDGKCICRISNSCKDNAPNLSSLCNVEFKDYIF